MQLVDAAVEPQRMFLCSPAKPMLRVCPPAPLPRLIAPRRSCAAHGPWCGTAGIQQSLPPATAPPSSPTPSATLSAANAWMMWHTGACSMVGGGQASGLLAGLSEGAWGPMRCNTLGMLVGWNI